MKHNKRETGETVAGETGETTAGETSKHAIDTTGAIQQITLPDTTGAIQQITLPDIWR